MSRRERAAAVAVLVMVCGAPAQGWPETFEAGTKSTYAAGDVGCGTGPWHLADALIGSSAGDRFFGAQSVRLRTGRLEMGFDKTNGVGVFSAYLSKYGTDGDSTVLIECSADSSNTWFQICNPVAVTSAALTLVAVPVNTNGTVRFRLSKQGATRVNIDNVAISDYGNVTAPPVIDPVAAQRVRIGQTLTVTLAITPTDGDPVLTTNATASSGVTGEWGLAGGVFHYTPAAGDVGGRSFTFAAADKDGTSAPVEMAVSVQRVQTPAWRVTEPTGVYTQNFNALALSGADLEWDNAATPMEAWHAYANVAEVTAYRTGTGSGTSGGIYSFGSSDTAPDRSLGSLASAGSAYLYGVAFTNETGETLSRLTVSFTGEQWRVANAATNTLVFEYCVTNGVLPLSQGLWRSVSALRFDSPAVTNASQTVGAIYVSAGRSAVLNPSVRSGEVIILRWRDADDAGNDHAFGIDDLTVTWSAFAPTGSLIGTVMAVR